MVGSTSSEPQNRHFSLVSHSSSTISSLDAATISITRSANSSPTLSALHHSPPGLEHRLNGPRRFRVSDSPPSTSSTNTNSRSSSIERLAGSSLSRSVSSRGSKLCPQTPPQTASPEIVPASRRKLHFSPRPWSNTPRKRSVVPPEQTERLTRTKSVCSLLTSLFDNPDSLVTARSFGFELFEA